MSEAQKEISRVWYAHIEIDNLISMLSKKDIFVPDSVKEFPQETAFYFIQPTEVWATLLIRKGKTLPDQGFEKDEWMAARAETFQWENSGVFQRQGWMIYLSIPFEIDQLQKRLKEMGVNIQPFLPAFTSESEYIYGRDRVERSSEPLFQTPHWVHFKTKRPCPWK